MKRFMKPLLLVVTAIAYLFIGCNNNEKTAGATRMIDIPITSKSAEAIERMLGGLALSDAGDRQKARAMFSKAIQLDPNLAVAYMYRANLALSAKEFVDELNNAKAHLEGASDWEKMYYEFQNTYITNDWNKRLEIAKKIVAAYPDAPRAQVDLGNTYQAANQVGEERAAFQKAIDLNPKWIGGYSALASSYLFSEPKDFKKAQTNALKVVELAPQGATAQIMLGDTYRAQDDLEKARAAYTKAVELDPELPESYYKKGHVNSFLGKYDEARKDYREGGKRDDDNLPAMLNIGNTYLYADEPKNAIIFFLDNAKKLDGSNASKSKVAGYKLEYLYSCAMACFHSGDAAKLKEVAAMMEAPSGQIANDIGTNEEKLIQKANVQYWWALADAMEGKLDAAKAKAEEMKTSLASLNIPANHKQENYEMIMGYVAMKEKKYTDAINHFEKANPNSIYTKYCQAMAHEAAGNKDKATELFKQVAIHNFNTVDFAVIRNEVKKKLATP